MTGRRVLGVFAHPDDEAYSAAGLFARCAAAGAEVFILCATRGEAGGVRDAGMLAGGSLAELRARELGASCMAMGAHPPAFLDWPDGGVAAVAPAERSETMAAEIRRVSPDVVVTLGRDGAYGHADHVAVTEVVAEVMAGAAPSARLLFCQFPVGLFRPLVRVMRKLGVALAPGVSADGLGRDPGEVDLRLSLTPREAQAKSHAIASHGSQRPRDDVRSFLLPGLIDPLLREEWYTVAAGPPVPGPDGDVFAGL